MQLKSFPKSVMERDKNASNVTTQSMVSVTRHYFVLRVGARVSLKP
jgi:hypothetical protein